LSGILNTCGEIFLVNLLFLCELYLAFTNLSEFFRKIKNGEKVDPLFRFLREIDPLE
jgi:hypothetical protein